MENTHVISDIEYKLLEAQKELVKAKDKYRAEFDAYVKARRNLEEIKLAYKKSLNQEG